MIIKPNDIREVRPIANNIVDVLRLEPYISDAETLDVMPALTPLLYKQFESIGNSIETDTVDINDNYGHVVTLTKEQYNSIFIPTFYKEDKCYSQGLVDGIGYLAYSRFVKNNAVNVTAFGVVFKKTANSEPVDEATLFRMANEAKKIGAEYINQTLGYIKSLGLIKSCDPNRLKVKKFKRIGR